MIALSFSVNSFAQTATPHVTERQVNQQARIQNGKQSGELTRKEKRHLQAQQVKIHRDKKAAKSDGVVTAAERRKLHREQSRASRNIYRQKHDAQTK
ncbi:MAG: hypothetical protein HC905_10645 [Bacteroidales bacterium]|nr:hypothetical protein [Bacteroidales bacterium]